MNSLDEKNQKQLQKTTYTDEKFIEMLNQLKSSINQLSQNYENKICLSSAEFFNSQNDKQKNHYLKFFQIKYNCPKESIGYERKSDYLNYKNAFINYIKNSADKFGAGLPENERENLNIGISSSGNGYMIPIDIYDDMFERIAQLSPLRKICSVNKISSNSITAPIFSDSLSTDWVTSSSDLSDPKNIVLKETEIKAHEHYCLTRINNSLLRDSQFDIEGWIKEKLALNFAVSEEQKFIKGSETNSPSGILSKTSYLDESKRDADQILCNRVTGGKVADDKWEEELSKLVFAVKSIYRKNACWIMNRSVLSKLKQTKDISNEYLVKSDIRTYEAKNSGILLGFPIYEVDAMDGNDGADKIPVAFGDFKSAYQIVDNGELSIIKDPYSNKPNVVFYATKRTGGGIINNLAVVAIKLNR